MLKESNDSGNLIGMNAYGLCYKFSNCGVEKDIEKCVYYVKKSADKGYKGGINNYGFCLENGEGVEPNFKEAANYYQMAMEAGIIFSFINYGNHIQYHGDELDIGENFEIAAKYYKIAADIGYSPAIHKYAIALSQFPPNKINAQQIVKYLMMGIELGNKDCMYFIGTLYKESEIVTKDDKLSLKYFKMAADLGLGMNDYAALLYFSPPCQKNSEEILKHFNKGAKLIEPQCLYNLGNVYDKGVIVEKDDFLSARYFKMAANLGHKASMYEYANKCYNSPSMQKYLYMGIELGNTDCMRLLGLVYREGEIVDKDKKLSLKYCKMATD